MDAASQDVVGQQRRYYVLARKDPPLIVPLRESRSPRHKPLEYLCPDANLANFISLGWVDVALVPRPLNSDRSLRNEITVLQSISLRFSQPTENDKVARQSLPLVED